MNYSDQVYGNVTDSLLAFLQAATAAGQPLAGFTVTGWDEFDPSRHVKKPLLLLHASTPRTRSLGIDGGYFQEEVDVLAETVDTIHGADVAFEFQLDLSTDTAPQRAHWTAVLERLFIGAETDGLAVMDQSAVPPVEVGRLHFTVADDLAHNFIPNQPGLRSFRNAIRFSPRYLHLFVQTPNQPMLTGVVLAGKPTEVI